MISEQRKEELRRFAEQVAPDAVKGCQDGGQWDYEHERDE